MKILVTGASGFIGRYLASYAHANGHEVVGTYLTEPELSSRIPTDPQVRWARLDLRDGAAVARLVRRVEPDAVFHLGAQAYAKRAWSDPVDTFDTNVLGTIRLYEALRERPPARGVLLTASAAAYGIPSRLPISEDEPLWATNPYGVSKACQEMVSVQYARNFGLRIVRARLFGTTGPGKSGDALNDFARQVARLEQEGRPAALRVGNLDARRDISDIRDAVPALWKVFETGTSEQPVNVGAGASYSVRSIVDRLIALARVPLTVQVDPALLRPTDEVDNVADVSRLRALGHTPRIPFETTISEALEFWRQGEVAGGPRRRAARARAPSRPAPRPGRKRARGEGVARSVTSQGPPGATSAATSRDGAPPRGSPGRTGGRPGPRGYRPSRAVGRPMVVGLVTSAAFPDLYPDDRLLLEALRSEGVNPEPVIWSDPTVRWERYDAVVLRSTWDYHRRIEEFLAWVDRVAGATRLFNGAPTVRWNSRKTYLRDLEHGGVPTVPTVWGSEVASATEALERRGWNEAVLKPAVSANAEEAHRLRREDREANETIFRRLRASGEVLLQPYLPTVEDPGERSLVFLDGRYSHAVLRSPRLARGSRLRDGEPVVPTRHERDAAVRALAAVCPLPLYARVDLVADPSGAPRVMELELIEPLLYLATSPGSPARLASALRRRLEPSPAPPRAP